jgi:cold shock CspA family protein
MQGIVKSFLREKGFGFIEDDNGQSYFFHQSNCLTPHNVVIGAHVEFEPLAKPKGMAAKSVVVVQVPTKIQVIEPGEFYTSKGDTCGKGNVVIFTKGLIYLESRDPSTAHDALRYQVSEQGGNAMLNFTRERRVGRSWLNMNYKYSIHCFTAEPALVVVEKTSIDKAEIDHQYAKVKRALLRLNNATFTSKSITDASGMQIVMSIIVGVIFFAFVFTMKH